MKEISMADHLGDLTPEQLDHLARGLEHAHEMTLEASSHGCWWLKLLDGGAILMTPARTVEHVWKCAEGIRAERENHNAVDP